MNDWSEVTSTLQIRVVKLCDALNDKKIQLGSKLALKMAKDLLDLVIHINKENK